MADEALRALERELAREGSPAARLRYARALEEAGRRVEAFEALLPATQDAAVRAELRRFPAWTHEHGGPEASGTIDVPLLPGQPRLVWEHEFEAGDGTRLTLRASPFGVVAGVARLDQAPDELPWPVCEVRVLDPLTGRLRWSAAGLEYRLLPLLAGEQLLLGLGGLLGDACEVRQYDLLGGELRGAAYVAGTPLVAEAGRLVCRTRAGVRTSTRALDQPALGPGWDRPLAMRTAQREAIDRHAARAGDMVLVQGAGVEGEAALVAFDAATGAPRWEHPLRRGDYPAFLADARGVVTVQRRAEYLDLDGSLRWVAPEPGGAIALTRDHVVLESSRARELEADADTDPDSEPPEEEDEPCTFLFLDRQRGEVVGRLELAPRPGGAQRADLATACADGLYVLPSPAEDRRAVRGPWLVAAGADGRVRWQLDHDPPGHDELEGPVLLPGRLIVGCAPEGWIRCYA